MTNDLVQPKQNNFIPMQDAEGNRCFVNAWDVPNRKAEGWKVVGDLAFHASSTRAPIEALESKGGQAAAAPAVPADPAADRARVVMQHAQIGYRDKAKSRRAYAEIWEALDKQGLRVDRYGICLDWSMGYPRAQRGKIGSTSLRQLEKMLGRRWLRW